jgi:hypothetical protein
MTLDHQDRRLPPLPTISSLGITLRTSLTPPLSRSDLVPWHKAALSICCVMSAAGESRRCTMQISAAPMPGPGSRPHCRHPFRHAATLAPSKGRPIRWTVPGSTPNRAAILRTPSVRPGLSRAALIAFSRSAGIGGRPSRLPSLLARASPARTRSWIIARSNSANTPII